MINSRIKRLRAKVVSVARILKRVERLPGLDAIDQVGTRVAASAARRIRAHRQARSIMQAGLFDAAWYLDHNPEVREAGMDPLSHYVNHGACEGRDPNPFFAGAWYLKRYPDVARAKMNPLMHYLHCGAAEGRNPHPLFDTTWYLETYPSVAGSGVNPLTDFIAHGESHDRQPNKRFDMRWYADRYLRDRNIPSHPFLHYLVEGADMGFDPHPLFDARWYRKHYQDTPPGALAPLASYISQPRWAHRDGCAEEHEQTKAARATALCADADIASCRVALGVVTYNNSASEMSRLFVSIDAAIDYAGLKPTAKTLVLDNGAPSLRRELRAAAIEYIDSQGNIGFGAGHNLLMKKAFAEGADYYIATNPDGAFHPRCIAALVAMAHGSQTPALIEALQFPEEHPKVYDTLSFETPWASGACLLIPRAIYEALGGFDDRFFMYCEDVDFSWRVRASGFTVKVCPRALFYHCVSHRPNNAHARVLRSSLILAKKWGGGVFERQQRDALAIGKEKIPDVSHVPTFEGDLSVAEFKQASHFAPSRW